MIIPINLNVKDFLSFKELQYNFQNGPVLITGENRTDEGQENNGSGKTSIQSAMEMCILDYTSRKRVKTADLIRRGESRSELTLQLKCSVRGEVLEIKRILNLKGSNALFLKVNDNPVSFATVNDGDNYIIDWIGISKEDISNYYIVNKERFQSFFSSSNTQKLQLIGRFSNTSFMEDVDAEMKERLKSVDAEKMKAEGEKMKVEGSIETIEAQIACENPDAFAEEKAKTIEGLMRNIEDERVCITTLKDKIGSTEGMVDEAFRSIETFKNNLLIVKQKIDNLNKEDFEEKIQLVSKDIEKSESKRSEEEKEAREICSLKDEALSELSEISLLLKGVVQCPKCGHNFSPGNSDVKPELLNKRRDELQSTIGTIEELIAETRGVLLGISKEIGSLRNKRNALQTESTEYYRHLSDISKEKILIEENITRKENAVKNYKELVVQLNDKIRQKELNIEEIQNKIATVEESSWSNQRLNSLYEELENLQSLIKIKDHKIDQFREERERIMEWTFKMKEFRMYLSNIGIKKIQQYCNSVLEDMESDLRINIEGFKMKADGTMKEEITPTIIRNEVSDFGLFSGGERGRLEYAMILAQQKIINETNPYGGLGFLFTDEIAEGIDSLGLKLISKSLLKFRFPILITTHVMNQSVDVRVLKVVKENNISKIEL